MLNRELLGQGMAFSLYQNLMPISGFAQWYTHTHTHKHTHTHTHTHTHSLSLSLSLSHSLSLTLSRSFARSLTHPLLVSRAMG